MEFEFLHKPILFDTDYIRHADDLYIFSLQSDSSDQNHGSCFKQFKNLHPHTKKYNKTYSVESTFWSNKLS